MHAPGDEHGALSWEVAQRATREALRHWPLLHHWRDDVLSDATLGVTLARNAYDPTRGVTYFTYALHRARGQILDGLRSRSPLTRAAHARGDTPPLPPRSLDEPIGRRNRDSFTPTPITLGDLIPDPRRPLDTVDDTDELHRILLLLPLRQAAVLCAYDLAGDTLAEFGARLGISESGACRLRKTALKNARDTV